MKKGTRKDERRISELRNLGPACERDLNAAGIFTAWQLKNLGEEVAFLKILEARHKFGGSTKCGNTAYLYALYGAIHEIDWRELPEKKKIEFKALTQELRQSGFT